MKGSKSLFNMENPLTKIDIMFVNNRTTLQRITTVLKQHSHKAKWQSRLVFSTQEFLKFLNEIMEASKV